MKILLATSVRSHTTFGKLYGSKFEVGQTRTTRQEVTQPMATSRNTGHRERGIVPRAVLAWVSSLSRYDLVVAGIPLIFALALVAHALATVPFQVAVAAAAVTSTLLLVDALYLNPPVDSDSNGATY